MAVPSGQLPLCIGTSSHDEPGIGVGVADPVPDDVPLPDAPDPPGLSAFADFAAAAHISCIDFLGDVPWEESEAAKIWYARIKSRPSFRVLLQDKIPGFTPPDEYADPDF